MTSTLAILFSDLVGSTEQRVRLGDAVADELRRDHFATTRDVVERHGGREVKNLGDGVLAVFSSTSAAVAASVSLQQAVARHNQGADADRRLGLRVGLSVGEVVEEDGDVFGGPVIEAARLCAEAVGGQILAGPAVVHLVDRAGRELLAPLGERELKGIAEPVAVAEVAWVRAPSEAVLPLQRRVEQVDEAFPFTGRLDEWTRLVGAFEAVREGERRLVAVGGEPGIGKTRLVHRLANHAHGEGGLVLCGRCDREGDLPYLPMAEALRHLVLHAPAPALAEHTGRRGCELAHLVPELLDRVPGLEPPSATDPATERYELLRAVNDVLGAVAGGVPTVLVLDDVHWVDRATLHLVRDLLTRDDALPMLVAVTYRDSEVTPAHPLSEFLAELERSIVVDRVPLAGLVPAEVLALVEGRAGHAIDDDAVAAITRIGRDTGGNPFFLTQMLRHLAEREVIRFRSGRWELSAPLETVTLPDTIREVVLRRIQQLDDTTAGLLRVAAVSGQWFDLDVVAAAAGVDEDAALDGLERSITLNLVQEDRDRPGRFGFVHALVRQTLEQELTATRRARMHLRLADELEEVDGGAHAPAVARHLCAAGDLADRARVLASLLEAARRSLVDLGYEAAVAFVDDALTRVDPDDLLTRADLLLVRGEAKRRMGDDGATADLMAVVDLARALDDAARLGRAGVALLRPGHWYTEALRVREDLVAPLEESLGSSEALEPVLRARVLAALASQLVFAPDQRSRAVELCDAAAELAARHGAHRVVADSLLTRWMLSWHPAGFDERDVLQRRLADLAAASSGSELRFTAGLLEVYRLLEVGDRDGVERRLDDLRDDAASLRMPYYSWLVRQVDGLLAVAAVVPDAEEVLDAGLELGLASAQHDALLSYGAQLVPLRRAQGRLDELAGPVDEVVAEYPVDAWRLAAALIWLASGEPDRARAAYEEVAAHGFAPTHDFTESASLVLGAELCATFADRRRAPSLVERLTPLASRVSVVGTGTLTLGSYARPLGLLRSLLGDTAGAIDCLATGVEVDRRMRSRYFELLGLDALDHALRARGSGDDHARATTVAARAEALAADLGCERAELVLTAPV